MKKIAIILALAFASCECKTETATLIDKHVGYDKYAHPSYYAVWKSAVGEIKIREVSPQRYYSLTIGKQYKDVTSCCGCE